MHITSLSLEQFGSCSNLSMDGFSGGLNVVFGLPGSGKTTMVHFLRTMFGGFDHDAQEKCRLPNPRGGGGSVTVVSSSGRQTISRYDDGGRDGRLSVQRPDGAVIGRRDLRELLGDLPHALLDLVYFVDFSSPPDLSLLLSEAVGSGYFTLQSEGEFDRERQAHLRQEVATSEQQLAALRRQIAEADRQLAELAHRQQQLEQSPRPSAAHLAASEKSPSELRAVEGQMERMKRTLRDVVVRKQRAAEQSDHRPYVPRRSTSGISLSEPRRILRSMEERIQELQHTVEELAPRSGQVCRCQSLRPHFAELLRQMSREVYALCNSLSQWQTEEQDRHAAEERDQLARCERELRQSLRNLAQRRQSLLDALDRSPGTLDPDHAHLCACQAHPQPTGGLANRPPSPRPARELELAEIRGEAERWSTLRAKWLVEVARWEGKFASDRQLLSQADRGLDSLTTMASEYLRRLSAGTRRRLHATSDRSVYVEEDTGRRILSSELDRSAQDQVYLAFCLAVVTAGQQHGWQVPAVWNAALTHCPSRFVRSTLELLHEAGRRHQIICLTRHEHVAQVAEQIGLPVLSLPPQESSTGAESTGVVAPGRWPASGGSRPRALESRELTDTADSEEHPASSAALARGRVLVDAAYESDYQLFDHDPIERTPSLDEANAARLRRIGLLRVGDLLQVAAVDLMADLRGEPVTLEMVESWQSQARLVCRIRGLRPYDARILAACGIRDPEQLIRLQPGALRARVKEFASTPQGKSLLMSGTEYELSRVSDWIGSLRDLLVGDHELGLSGTVPHRVEPAAGDGDEEGVGRERRRERVPRARAARREDGEPEQNAFAVRRWRDAEPSDPGAGEQPKATSDQAAVPERGRRFYLQRSHPIADAPSVGASMARRLERIGIATVADLLAENPEELAARLELKRITGATIRQWQQQCELVLRVPGLRGHDAQFLVAAGTTTVEQLAASDPQELWRQVRAFAESIEGKRLTRGGEGPDLAEVSDWVSAARQARTLLAA